MSDTRFGGALFFGRDPLALTGRDIGDAYDGWADDERAGSLFGLAIGLLRARGFSHAEVRELMNETLDDVEAEADGLSPIVRESN